MNSMAIKRLTTSIIANLNFLYTYMQAFYSRDKQNKSKSSYIFLKYLLVK